MLLRYLVLFSLIFILPLYCSGQDNSKKESSFGLTISLPWVNSYSYYDYELKKSSSKSGFTGLGGSFFYKKRENKISLNFGLTGDLPAPIGAFDYAKEGTRSNIGSLFFEGLYHRRVWNKLNVIGGLNYINYRFNFTSYVAGIPSYIKNTRTIGLTTGSEYSFNRGFSLALFYRPALISFNAKQYRHLISLDARFDIIVLRK